MLSSSIKVLLPNIPGFTKMLAWHERSHQDAGHRWIRELLVRCCGNG